MFQNSAIDVAIGLIAMYLALSLLCTVVNEFIATKLKLRANNLAAALEKLLDDKTLRDAFYQHGLIVGAKNATTTGMQSTASAVAGLTSAAGHGLKRMMRASTAPAVDTQTAPANKADHPSYLPSRSVALALIGCLDPSTPIPVPADIEAAVTKLPVSNIRSALLSSLTEAQHDFDKLQASIATWFDDSMDRLSGAYKRQVKWIAMLIGLFVAIAFNADSVNVATTLWTDAGRRAAAVATATELGKRPLPAPSQDVDNAQLRKAVNETGETLRLLSVPIGWDCFDKDKGVTLGYRACATRQLSLLTVLGWLLTAAALSLGAPFWFDLLNKFINIRGAGAKPKREDEKAVS